MRCYIYRAKNKINGKTYIGFTSRCLEERMKEHAYLALNGSTFNFHKALRKHGIQAFEWTLLFESDDEEYCLNEMEPYFISEHRSFGKHGYNMTKGGDRGPRMPGETNPMFGRTHTKEARDRIRKAQTGRWKGKTYEDRHGVEKAKQLRHDRSEMMKEHRRKNPVGGKRNPNYDRTIYRFEHDDGQVFEGTIYDLRQHDPRLDRYSTRDMKRGYKSRGWKLIACP